MSPKKAKSTTKSDEVDDMVKAAKPVIRLIGWIIKLVKGS